MITKTCRHCNQEKSGNDFPKGRDSNGLYYICKQCTIDRNKRIYRNKDPIRRWVDCVFSDVKGRATKNKVSFLLSKEFLYNALSVQNNTCVYCEALFDFQGSQVDHRKSPSLDRLVPTGGYTVENTVICCYRCNTIKNDASITELKKLVENLETILNKLPQKIDKAGKEF